MSTACQVSCSNVVFEVILHHTIPVVLPFVLPVERCHLYVSFSAESRRRTSNTPAANLTQLSSVVQQHRERSPYSLSVNDSSDRPDEEFDVSPTEEMETEGADEITSGWSGCPPSKRVKSEEGEAESSLPGM